MAELLESEQGERLCRWRAANGIAGFLESFWLWNSKLNTPRRHRRCRLLPLGESRPAPGTIASRPARIALHASTSSNSTGSSSCPGATPTASGATTIRRTTYTPEADALFPIALARLKSYIYWWCHFLRFPHHPGTPCDGSCGASAEPNEEVSRRLYFDVVEDRDGLAHLDSTGDASAEDRFTVLGAYFR